MGYFDVSVLLQVGAAGSAEALECDVSDAEGFAFWFEYSSEIIVGVQRDTPTSREDEVLRGSPCLLEAVGSQLPLQKLWEPEPTLAALGLHPTDLTTPDVVRDRELFALPVGPSTGEKFAGAKAEQREHVED